MVPVREMIRSVNLRYKTNRYISTMVMTVLIGKIPIKLFYNEVATENHSNKIVIYYRHIFFTVNFFFFFSFRFVFTLLFLSQPGIIFL